MAVHELEHWYIRTKQYLQDALDLVDLTYSGTHILDTVPDLVRLLNEQRPDRDPDRAAADIAHAEHTAKLVSSARATDFALLHAHTIMGVWGALEAGIEDLVVAWLADKPDLLAVGPLANQKLVASLFESLPREERMRQLVTDWRRGKRFIGVTAFESVLELIRLDGGVSELVRSNLRLMQQYRHLVAHRGGVADQRFVDICPDLGYITGDVVRINRDQMGAMLLACTVYAAEVDDRVLRALKLPAVERPIPTEWAAPGSNDQPMPQGDRS